MRRFSRTVLMCSLGALLGAIWKPGAVQKSIVDHILKKINAENSYQVRVDSVSGDFVSHITLNGVHVTLRDGGAELLEARVLDISVEWTGLLRRRLKIRRLSLLGPTLRLTLSPEGEWIWPQEPQTPKEDESFAFFIESLTVKQGQVVFRNRSVEPALTLPLGPLELSAALSPEQVTIQRLDLSVGSGSLSLVGSVGRKDPQDISLQGQSRALPLHYFIGAVAAPPRPLRLIHSGRWTMTRQGGKWQVLARGALNEAPLEASVRARRAGYVARVALKPLALKSVWRDPRSGRLGTFSASLEASAPQWSSKAPDVSGTWRIVQPSTAGVQAPTAAARMRLVSGRGSMEMQFSAEGLQAGATAELDLPARRIHSPFQLKLENFQGLAEWVPELREAQGTVTADGVLSGSFSALSLKAAAEAKHLHAGDKTVEEAQVTMDGGLRAGQSFDLEVKTKNAALHDPEQTPWDVSAAVLRLQGKSPQWRATLESNFRNGLAFNYAGLIEKLPHSWRLSWDRLALAPKKGDALHNTKAGDVLWAHDGTWTLQDLDLSNGQGHLSVPRTTFKEGRLNLQLTIVDVPLASLASLISMDKKYDGLLNASARLDGPWRAPEGAVDVRISTGSVQNWKFKAFTLRTRLAPPHVSIDRLDVELPNKENAIHGQGRIPLRFFAGDQPDADMDFQLDAPHLDPEMLTVLVPGLDLDAGGNAALNLKMTGSSEKPDVRGRFEAHFSRLRLAPAGLDVRDFAADIRTQGKTLTVHQLTGRTKKGEFHGGGESVLPNLNFTLQGKGIQLHIPKKLDAQFDLDLLLGGDLEGPDVSGDINLGDVTYTAPRKKKEKKAEAEDEGAPQGVELNAEGGSPLWQALTLNVHVAWPRKVWYRDGLSKVETAGDFRVQKDEDSPTPYLTGRIGILRGNYDVYGRDFIMNSGDIVFTGPPDINPLLNLEATYTGGGAIIYLDVKGTAKDPQPTLRSDPPLPQNDIVSVLVFGHPLNQVNAGGATSDQSQAQAMAGSVVGGYLTRSLRESGMDLGLDVVRVDTTNTGSNRLTVGRYIGNRLFVSYGQTLQNSAVRVFDASYYLTNYWSLVNETGASTDADSFVDLLFRYPLNRRTSTSSTGLVTNTPFLPGPVQSLPFPQPNPTPAR